MLCCPLIEGNADDAKSVKAVGSGCCATKAAR